MIATAEARKEATRARFTTRLAFFEEPAVAERLERLAYRSGRSVAAEIRAASRYWLAAHGDDD